MADAAGQTTSGTTIGSSMGIPGGILGGISLITSLGVALGIASVASRRVPPARGNLGSLALVPAAADVHKHMRMPDWKFVNLPFGRTCYTILGPASGKKVVFVHGISCPPICFPTFLTELANKGMCVLVYDHYGRGYSDSPPGPYTIEFYVSQLVMLLHKLEWSRTSIIGYSLGGAISAKFIASYPHMVDRIAFIAPAGLISKLPRASIITKIPFFGPLIFYAFGRFILVRISESNHSKTVIEGSDIEHLKRVNAFMVQNHPGFLRAYYSTVSEFKFNGNEDSFEAIEASHGSKTIIVWGTNDVVVPYTDSPRMKALMPSAKFVSVDGLGHSIVAEIPGYMSKTVFDFLNKSK